MFFQKQDKEAAQAVMDALSEKYKGFEDKLIDTTNFKVIVLDLNTAYVDSKYKDGRNYEHYAVYHEWYYKIFGIKLSRLIDWKIKSLKRQYTKKNNTVKELADLKAKYNDTSTHIVHNGIYMPSPSTGGILTVKQLEKELKKRGII
jgi:hypothetical protein